MTTGRRRCRFCKASLRGRRDGTVFCNSVCRNTWRCKRSLKQRQWRRIRIYSKRTCKLCKGAMTVRPSIRAVYCSSKCGRIAHEERMA